MAKGAPNSPNSPSLGAGDEVLGRVKGTDGTDVWEILSAGADNVDNALPQLWIGGALYVFNGTTWDRARGDLTSGTYVGGAIAHGAADSGQPVKVGFIAYSPDGTTPGTAVAELDRTNGKADLDGRQFVNTVHPRDFSYHYDSTSAVVTDGAVAADPGDGFAVFITDIVFSIGVATASSIFLEEATTKILGPYYLEAIAGRGVHVSFATPKRCTASTAILVTTTGAISLAVDILGFVAAV